MNGHITTAELDSIARLGLDDLRACFVANAPEGSMEKAELTLKILRQGTSRMSGENNRLAMALKIAKAAGIPQEEQKILWKQIAAPSGQMIAESQESLTYAESTGKRQESKRK